MSGRERTTERVVTRLLTSITSAALGALWLMLCEGAVAGAHGWPTLSYWESLLVLIGLGGVVQYGTLSIYWRTGRGDQR